MRKERQMAEEEKEQKQVEAEEQRAKISGWRPEDEFKGDPDRFTDAETWNKRTDEVLPIMKASNKRLEADLISTKAELENLKRVMNSVVKAGEKVSKREYDRALETIRKKQGQAIKDQDGDLYQELEEKKDKLEKPTIAKPIQNQPQAEHPDFQSWKADNPWYDANPDMQLYADTQVPFIISQNPNLTGRAFFDTIKKEVERRFPERFENPKRKKKSNVDAGGDTRDGGGGGKKGKTYSDLPADAKKYCDNLIKDMKGYKTPDEIKKQYAEDYFEEE